MYNEFGIWEMDNESQHGVDYHLAHGLDKFFTNEKAKSIYDLGCGNGFYSRFLQEYDFDVECYDGNPNTGSITKNLCGVLNLAQPISMPPREWILCLEVGEHIPDKYEQIFIYNLTKHATKGIVLSWAVPGQGGYGHVNCKTNEDVKEMMLKNCFVSDEVAQTFLRTFPAEYPTPCYWFRDTLMVFRKEQL